MSLDARVISVYQNSKDLIGIPRTTGKVIEYIREGRNGLDEKTKHCNALAVTEAERYKKYKASELPAVTWACQLNTRDGKVPVSERLVKHSGRVVIDIDGVDVGEMLSALFDNPFVYFAFVSPSGQGVKIVSPVDPLPTSAHEHKVAWREVKSTFDELQAEVDFTIDESGKDVTRLCYLAHDPRAIYRGDARAVTWDPDDAKDFEKAPNSLKRQHWSGEIDLTALDYIDPDSPYEVWLSVGMACKNAGVPFEQWDTWSAGGSKYNPNEMQSKWASFNRTGITWGTVVFFAKQKGYEPPRTYQKPVRLTSEMLSDVLTETLDDAQDFIKSTLAKDTSGQVFGLRVDTGTGKTEQTLVVRNARPIVLTGSHLLGTEIADRATQKGIPNFLYRGLMHNPGGEFPYESPCAKAVFMDELRRAGANPYLHGCPPCNKRGICEVLGMRAQWKKLKDENSLLVLAMQQLFIDPIYRNFAKNRLHLTANDIVLVDDASTDNLFLDVSVSLERLQRLSRRWKGKATGDFALELITAISTFEGEDLISGIKSVYEKAYQNKTHRDTIYRQLGKVNVSGTELNIDDAISSGHYLISTSEQRARLPIVEHRGWTLLDKLRIFFKAYPDPKTAPMRYADSTLHWALPPQLLTTQAALGFMGATLDKDIFKKIFSKGTRYRKDVGFWDAGTTEWHGEARVFQLRTNGNPRATLLRDKNTGELSRTGEEYWNYFLQSLEVNDRKHAMISFKSLVSSRADELKTKDVSFSYFHNTEGLDTHFSDCDIFHILGLPARTPTDTEWLARVWQVSEKEVIQKILTSELTQAVGRARLVRKPATVVIWTSQYIENITDRAILFDETDWKQSNGDLNILADVVSKREGETDIQAIMEAEGVSQRTAYRRTEEPRAGTKAERDADILRLHGEGIKQVDIVDYVTKHFGKVNKSTVSRTINKKLQN